MALASEGFSIREYAAKMRTVDVEKCWPFGRGSEGEIKKKDIEAFLPPITVTKFRWWSHELEGSLKSSRTHEEWAPVSRAEVEFPRSGSEFHAQKAEHEKSVMEEQKLDMVCPVCRLFTAGTVNAVNAHMDSCLAQPSKTVLRRQMKKQAMKTKAFREPKKRSIAEIFAVAPQIESADVDDEIADGDCNSKEDKFGSCKVSSWAKVVSTINCNKNRKMKMKRSKKKKKGRVLEENRIAIARKMKQNMRKFKKVTMKDGSIAKKERLHKLKLPLAVDFTRKLNGSVCNKRFSEDIFNATSVRGKKPSLRGLSMQKKLKAVQTSKLIVKPQTPMLPVRSILKNHKNALFGLNSAICSLQCSSQKNHSRIQHSDRHVRFSDKDVILGPAQKHTADAFEHSNGKLFSDPFAVSSEKYPATEYDKEVAPMEVDRTDGGVFISTNNGSDVRVIAGRENLLNTHSNGDPQRSLRQHVTFQDKIKHFPENSVCLRQAVIHDDNEHMFDQGHLTMSHKPAYTGIPSLISATEGRCNPCLNAQVGGDVMRAFNQSGKLAFLDTNRGVPATCSMAFIGASSPPSTSCAASDENANRRLPFLSQSATETFNGRILQYQPLCHASPKVLMNSMRSLPEWKQRAVLREKYPDDGFLGLPLNSQGELIQFSSSGKGAFDQLMLPSAMTCSSSTLAVHNLTTPQRTREYVSVEKSHTGEGELSRDLLNLFPVQNYVIGNPKVHLPAIFGVTELEGTERSDLHWLNSMRGTNHSVRPLDSHLHWSFNGCGQYDQVQNQNVYGINHPQENSYQIGLNSTPPTMRLMGKDVAVGRSSKEMQGFGDGRLWTAKEMITRDCPTSSGLENSSMERNLLQDWLLHPASGQSNILGQSSASQSNHTSRSNFPIEASKAMFPNPFFNWQTNVVHRDGSLTINENPTNKVHSFLHSPASSRMFNGAHSFQESFITEAETLSSSSQLPLQSNHHFGCQHMPRSPVEGNHKQNVPHATKSAYNFPFLQPDYQEHVQPSGLQRFSRSLPPWLLHPHQDKPLITSSHSFSEVGGKYLPQFISGTNLFPSQHVNHLQEVSYPMNSQSHIKRSFGPASILHPALVPVIPGVNPTSAINMNCRSKVKLKDAVKSKAFRIKDPNPCKRTKRPAAQADCSTKPTWIPNLEMQKHLSAMTELTRENIGRDIPCHAGMVDSNLSKDKARRLGCCSNESPKDGLRTSTGSDFSAEYNSAISGPVKLCAGAKHILKPSQAMDQDNARPIHSSLPFAIAANCDNILDSRKRLTKIYQF